jgi:hypothetical protein
MTYNDFTAYSDFLQQSLLEHQEIINFLQQGNVMAQSMQHKGAVETLQENLIFCQEANGYHSGNKIHMIINISELKRMRFFSMKYAQISCKVHR